MNYIPHLVSNLFDKISPGSAYMESKWLPGPVGAMLRSSGIATTTAVPLNGKLVTTTTHVGLDLATGHLVTSSREDEFTAIFTCLDAALRNAGIQRGMGDAQKITAYLIDQDNEPILQKIFRNRYPGHSPAWATAVVSAIVVPNIRAEVQAEAILLQ
ncbi:hypothetical protein PENSTE_c025G08687 [Penicillium steckii]|uniref:Uncharacterized protein n=1 Tax=Penicillium steckii TaxID=303698 RepID=A0A1V6SQ37_9EURO|nr:hypothetical protein PENSTE_c025G08687 [Penicillium steckii]